MQMYFRLAWRNIWRHRRRTLIVALAIGFTLSLSMIYDGLVAGFEDAIYGNAIRVLGGNIQVHTAGYSDRSERNPLLPLTNDQAVVQAFQSNAQVVGASRRINTGGMVTNRKGAFGVGITGIEPEKELTLSIVGQHVSSGRFLTAADTDLIFIGKGLADTMEVAVGDRITLVGRASHQQMRTRTMTIAGIFDLNMPDIEKQSVYMSLAEAQDLYGLSGQSTEVVVALKHLGDEPAVMNALRASLPGTEMISWQTSYPELESAINTKGGVMNIFSIVMLVIIGIGILNLLLMAVYERTREIGLLGALGMKSGQITLLFLLEGILMGLVGMAFGVVFGLLINLLLGQVGLDYTKFSSLTSYMALISGKIYPSLGIEKLGQHVLTVIVITTLASYYPAREAAHHEPAQALHYV